MSMEARRNAGRNTSGDAVAHSLNPNHPYKHAQYAPVVSRATTGKHQRANRHKIRQIEQQFKQKQIEEEQRNAKPVFRMRQFTNVNSRISANNVLPDCSSTQDTSPNVNIEGEKYSFLRKGSGINRRQQVSAHYVNKCEPGNDNHRTRRKPQIPQCSKLSTHHHHHHHNDNESSKPTNFIARNLKSAMTLVPHVKAETIEVPVTDRTGFGRVPLYIHQRKVELAAKQEEKRLALEKKRLPAGMTLMSDEERVRTVALLRTNQTSLLAEISHLPLTIETSTMIERSNSLHERLHEVEEALKLFTRQKVYLTA